MFASARSSSLETAVADELDRRGIAYEWQAPLGRFVADFLLLESDTVVECDGTYWHSRPGIAERDARKDAVAESLGYRMVRLTEEAIRADVAAAVENTLT